jgi:hypothetical protein
MAPEMQDEAAMFRDSADVKLWRKTERERLVAERLAISPEHRREHAARIADRLDELVHPIAGESGLALANCLTFSPLWVAKQTSDLRIMRGRLTP